MNKLHLSALLTAGACLACSGTTTNTSRTTLASASACGNLSDAGQTIQNLYEPGAFYSAKPIRKKVFIARAAQPIRTFGATLYTRAEPGVTEPYLERVLSCHAAFGQAAHPNDPLHPSSGQITKLSVEPAGSSFAVRIESDSHGAGKEIWQRAQSLSGRSSTVEVEQVGSTPGSSSNL